MSENNGNMKNVPLITPTEFLDIFEIEYKNKTPEEVRPVMLWGAPGVGKSDTVKQLANLLSKVHNKPYFVRDVRLSLYNPVDLKGIPYPDKENNVTNWLKPDIFLMDESDEVGNIIFFDEISNATPAVASATYQIILDRQIANHKLPENCYIICAGNRVSDKSATYKMPSPLANRLMHFEFSPSLESWKIWAMEQKDFDRRVISFLNYKPQLLFGYVPGTDEVAFPTPRSWSAVGKLTFNRDINKIMPLIEANIGKSVALEFLIFMKVYDKLPNIESIASGEDVEVPAEPDVVYATSGALISHMETLDKDDVQSMENITKYILKMKVEFQASTFTEIANSTKLFMKLYKTLSFKEWIDKNESLLKLKQ